MIIANIMNGLAIVGFTAMGYYAWMLWYENQSLKTKLEEKKSELRDCALENSTIQNRLNKINELSK